MTPTHDKLRAIVEEYGTENPYLMLHAEQDLLRLAKVLLAVLERCSKESTPDHTPHYEGVDQERHAITDLIDTNLKEMP